MSLQPSRINLKCVYNTSGFCDRTYLIAGVFVRFIMGLLGSIATAKDTTENTNKDPIENKNPIENTEADEPSLSSLPTGAVSTDTAPPPLVSEPKGPRTPIK